MPARFFSLLIVSTSFHSPPLLCSLNFCDCPGGGCWPKLHSKDKDDWKETNDLLHFNFTVCEMFCLSFLRLAPMAIAALLPLCEWGMSKCWLQNEPCRKLCFPLISHMRSAKTPHRSFWNLHSDIAHSGSSGKAAISKKRREKQNRWEQFAD